MKKIIFVLFLFQMLIFTFYGLLYLRSSNYFELMYKNNTLIRLNFDNDLDDFRFFLALIEEKDLVASRAIFPSPETLMIYTTDTTLGGRVSLLEGEFPTRKTAEFISTLKTGEEMQVGLIADIIPGLEIIVTDIYNPRNFILDGLYDINTTDRYILQSLLDELSYRLAYVELFGVEQPTNEGFLDNFRTIFFSMTLQDGFETLQMQVIEFIIIFSILVFCIFISVIQYVLNHLKASAIYFTHGFSKIKVIQRSSWKLIKTFCLSSAIMYMLTVCYLFYMNRMVFLSRLTQLSFIVMSSLIFLYLSLAILISFLAMKNFKITTVLKGQKFDSKIQVVNHLTKGIFTVVFLILFSFTLTNFQVLNNRLDALSHWEKAQNVHRITVSSAAGISTMATLNSQKIAFFHDLVNYHQGFIMDSTDIYWGDFLREEGGNQGPPGWEPHLLNRGINISISPSFLEINPIYDLNGNSVLNQLIFDDYVLNILIPERFMEIEEEIQRIFNDVFRSWREMNDQRELPTEFVPRKINSIHVADQQYYFSFNHRLRIEDGNRVKDSLVMIYHGKLADAFIPSLLTNSVYFHATTTDPFNEIESLIYKHGLQTQIQQVESIYSLNAREVRVIQEHQVRLITLLGILLVANVAVAYNLVANYYERSKFQIFLKSTFGWGWFKQNRKFILTYLIYTVSIILILMFYMGEIAFLMGLIVLCLDLISMSLFQKKLLEKSFSEIMKGER